MFEIGDLVWYRGRWGQNPPVAAVVTGSGAKNGATAFVCLVTGQYRGSWGYPHQFESRQCILCADGVTKIPGCPLCPGCIETEAEMMRDALAESEQRRRPL